MSSILRGEGCWVEKVCHFSLHQQNLKYKRRLISEDNTENKDDDE